MTEKIVERVARAMFENSREESASRGIQSSWENYPLKEHFINMARAAINAMRDPTEAMKDAGADADDDYSEASPTKAAVMIFTAMIDAALKE